MLEVFPACAVTRAMTKQMTVKKSARAPTSNSENPTPCSMEPLSKMNSEPASNGNRVTPPLLTREQLIDDQQADPEL